MALSGVRYTEPKIYGAPQAVSQDLQQFTRFLPGRNSSSLRMHTCFAVCNVLRQNAIASDAGAIEMLNANPANSLQLNLTSPARLTEAGTKGNADYLSPIFDLIGSAFVRYKVDKAVFHYEPQSPTDVTQRMVFAFAQDPVHPVLWNSSGVTQNELLSQADSIAFAPWRAWSMNVTNNLQKTLLYTYSSTSTTAGEFDERFSDFGVISMLSSDSSTGTDTPCGVLYLEAIIELHEFCPITTVSPSSKMMLAKKLALTCRDKKKLEQQKQKSEKVSKMESKSKYISLKDITYEDLETLSPE